MMKKAIAYIRKSTKSQELSFRVQEKWIKDFCNSHGYECIKIFTDVGSGRTNERAGLKEAIKFIEFEHDCFLIVGRIDRIARNLSSLALLEPHINKLRSVNLGDTPVNEMLLTCLLSIAKSESEAISMRVKASYEAFTKANPGKEWGSRKGLVEGRKTSLKNRRLKSQQHCNKLLKACKAIDPSWTMTWRQRTLILNELGLTSPTGKQLSFGTLRASCIRANQNELEFAVP